MSCTTVSTLSMAITQGPAAAYRRAAARSGGARQAALLRQQRRHGRRCGGEVRRFSGGEVEGGASADPELVAGVVHGKYLVDTVSNKPPTELGEAAVVNNKPGARVVEFMPRHVTEQLKMCTEGRRKNDDWHR